MSQLHLFDRETLPPHNGTETSQQAAQSVESCQGRLQRLVLDFVTLRGRTGATRQEIEAGTGLSGNTVRPRVKELIEAGKLRETEETRKTPSGRNAVVLVDTLVDEIF